MGRPREEEQARDKTFTIRTTEDLMTAFEAKATDRNESKRDAMRTAMRLYLDLPSIWGVEVSDGVTDAPNILVSDLPDDPTVDAPIPSGGLHRHRAKVVGDVYYVKGVPTVERICAICGETMEPGRP